MSRVISDSQNDGATNDYYWPFNDYGQDGVDDRKRPKAVKLAYMG